jgi:Zn-dependent protease
MRQCHPPQDPRVVLSEAQNFVRRKVMKRLAILLIPLSFMALSGCVVAPYGYYHRGWYGPRVAVVAPAPVVVVRP